MEKLELKKKMRELQKYNCVCDCKACGTCVCRNKLTDPIESREFKPICPVIQRDEDYDAIILYDDDDVYSEYVMEEIYRYMKTMYQLRLCRSNRKYLLNYKKKQSSFRLHR